MATYEDMIGSTVYDKKKEPIGTLEEFYVDDISKRPTWITVDTSFGKDVSFVPLANAHQVEDGLQVEVTKDQIKDAPQIEAQERIDENQENKIYEYYNQILGSQSFDNAAQRRDNDYGTDNQTSSSQSDDAMTRSEEELDVQNRTVESGKVRLKKYIVTENVSFDIPVQHEEVRVVQEPITDENIDDAMEGPELKEDQHEVTLHGQQVTVDKKVKPKERIRLDKDTVEDKKHFDETLRKEEFDIKGDGE
jgi:uncharacterized protein (TIGR02271 family)